MSHSSTEDVNHIYLNTLLDRVISQSEGIFYLQVLLLYLSMGFTGLDRNRINLTFSVSGVLIFRFLIHQATVERCSYSTYCSMLPPLKNTSFGA